MLFDAKIADIERAQPVECQATSAHASSFGRGALSRCLRQSLEVEQLPSLYPEVERVPDQIEHQPEGQPVGRSPRAGDEPGARLAGWLEPESSRHMPGIVAGHQCPAWLDNPDDKTALCLWRHREDIPQLDPLEFRTIRSALGTPPLSRPS